MNEATNPDNYSGPVTEIAIRRLLPEQAIDQFADHRGRFIALLREQPGVSVDREFAAVFDFSTYAAPDPAVFIGMTQYDDAQAFAAAGETLGSRLEAAEFFSTFTPHLFTVLRPLNPADRFELASVCAAPGQVLEVAHRDLSAYADLGDYDAKRRAFLDALRDQDGVVAEYQWVSVLEPNIVVGMTVYDSAEAFQALASSPFATSAATTEFVAGYPPLSGFASVGIDVGR